MNYSDTYIDKLLDNKESAKKFIEELINEKNLYAKLVNYENKGRVNLEEECCALLDDLNKSFIVYDEHLKEEDCCNNEMYHINYDEAIINILIKLGYPKIALYLYTAKQHFWYS